MNNGCVLGEIDENMCFVHIIHTVTVVVVEVLGLGPKSFNSLKCLSNDILILHTL